jgi:2-desacetyl-2-hydroxyethyl bacteriochlorophyllide A dehydrogenase
MRAAVFQDRSSPLQIADVADPTPGPQDLILKVGACGLCGSDLHLTEPGSMLPLASGAILGHEFAGEVVAIGTAVRSQVRIGDRVAGFPALCCGDSTPCPNQTRRFSCRRGLLIGLGTAPGAYAEYVRISAGGAHRLPDNVSFREGALIEPLAVGLHAVDMARLPRGATVLVLGAGPVGLATALFARLLGARHVLVSERAASRRQLAAQLGATAAVDPTQPLLPQVRALAGSEPDAIFECVGAPGMLDLAMAEAPHGGQIIVAGVCQGRDSIRPILGIAKELRIQFVLAYAPADFDYVIDLVAGGRIDPKPMITDIVDLDGLPAAFEALRTPTHQCKVLLEP